MSKAGTPLDAKQLAIFKKLAGPPPVLSSENPTHFEAWFDAILQSIGPRDFVEFTCLWHYVCAEWLIKRYTRHATLSIERRYQEQQRALASAATAREQRKEAAISNATAMALQQPADVAMALDLERKQDAIIGDLDEILDRPRIELAQNRSLEASINIQELLSKLIASQIQIRNNALEQLEIYQTGLGQRLADVVDETVDAEFTEVPRLTEQNSPSLTTSEDTNDITSQASSEPAQ